MLQRELKEKIWKLQIHLTHTERQQWLDKMSQKNIDLQESLEKTLEYISFSKRSRKQPLNKSNADFLSFQKDINHPILLRSEIEDILKRDLYKNSTLAFQYLGSLQALKRPLLAIVGARHPTYYGREQTHRFAKILSKAGCGILSGGAIGIDSIANAVGLEFGYSCAVIGSGLERLYPSSNVWLFNRMKCANNGIILSEFEENLGAQKWHFPQRNHSIALLADFVLVIEASEGSGSLITAHAAAEYGVEVGALPGCVDSVNSAGCHSLIKTGAHCITTPEDILEILHRNLKIN